MAARESAFNRLLLAVLVVLFLVSLGWFTYANWIVDPNPRVGSMVVNGLILSLPLVLFYGSIYVLVRAWRDRRQTGQIGPPLAKVIRWAPRVAAIAITFFITLFSLDVFAMGGSFLEQLGAFLIHSLPSIAMIALLAIAWKRPAVGFVAFLLAGLVFFRFVIGQGLPHFLLFSGPLLLVAALFYADWRWNRPRPAAASGLRA